MRKKTIRWTILLIASLALVVVLTGNIPLQAKAADHFPKPVFNDKGELLRPDISYREWIYIGTPLTPNELNPPEAPFPNFTTYTSTQATSTTGKERGYFLTVRSLLKSWSSSVRNGP